MLKALLVLLFAGLWLGGLRDPAIWTVAALALWVGAIIRPPSLKAVPAARLWGAWLIWLLLSALLSSEPYRSVAIFARPLSAVLFFAFACQWQIRERRAWFWLLVASAAGLGLATLYDLDPSYPHVGLLFPYFNYTVCVETMAFAACLAALSAGKPKARYARFAVAMAMAIWIALIIVAKSRGGLVACAAIGVLALARRAWSARTRPALRPVLAAGVLILAGAAASYPVWRPLLKFDRPGAYVRPKIWRSSVAIAMDYPLLGTGPGLFERGFQVRNFAVDDPRIPSRFGMRAAHADSEPLEAAAETGWPGLALFLSALGVSWLLAWKRTSGRTRGEDAWLAEAGLLAASVALIQVLFDNLFSLPALHWLFFSALAVASGPPERRADSRPATWIRVAALAGLALAASAWVPDWLVGRWNDRALRTLEVAPMYDALRLAPGDPGLWEDLARIYMHENPPARGRAFSTLGSAALLDPTNAAYPLMQGEIAAGASRWHEAAALARRALALEPDFLEARLLEAEAACRTAGTRAAAGELDAALAAHRRQEARFGPAGPRSPIVMRFDAAKYERLRRAVSGGCR